MKLLLFMGFVAIIYNYADAGKTGRLLAALNGGMLTGLNGGLMNGANPVVMVGGLNPPVVAGGGAGFIGQPQFAQFVPAFRVQAPIPNMYPVPAVNAQVPSYMGVPQMAPMNIPQQPMMGFPGGVVPQQLPFQQEPLRRFRRQIMKRANALKGTLDTQIPPPTESKTTTAPCDQHRPDN